MTFRPQVLVADSGRELRWLGRLILPGIFDGEHSFRLVPLDEATRLIHAETFRGALVWLIDTDRFCADFTSMNEALKRRVEGPGKKNRLPARKKRLVCSECRRLSRSEARPSLRPIIRETRP
jgi:hypothetical protein